MNITFYRHRVVHIRITPLSKSQIEPIRQCLKTKKTYRLYSGDSALFISSILKTLPIKDTLSLYRDYLYVGLIFFILLILTGVKVNKKLKVRGY